MSLTNVTWEGDGGEGGDQNTDFFNFYREGSRKMIIRNQIRNQVIKRWSYEYIKSNKVNIQKILSTKIEYRRIWKKYLIPHYAYEEVVNIKNSK